MIEAWAVYIIGPTFAYPLAFTVMITTGVVLFCWALHKAGV